MVARVFGLPRRTVSDETSNTTVETWDSLNHVTLILELEAAFGITLSAEEALSMTDVAAIKRVLRLRNIDVDT